MNPCARFDDHTIGSEQAFELRNLERTVVARRLEDVVPALVDVERAVAAGRYAGGFISYEAAPAFDRALQVLAPATSDPFAHLPLVWFGIFEEKADVEPFTARADPAPYRVSTWRPEITRAAYDRAITEIRGRIADGDTYQVNLTFRLRAAFSGDADELYRDLVLAQRGAYAASFDLGRYRILSASPERFFHMEGGRIEMRPMKGTIRRGRWPAEDDDLAARLLTSEKDRAENLMIVDLIRNDLGRIARIGSVTVDRLLAVERFETLWQLTSSVSADLEPDVGLGSVMAALFPSGSVTGAPKASTMDIITQVERSPRGVYCGALGYMTPPGDGGVASFSVGIRTLVIDCVEGVASYGVGGGITWDSDAASEYEEARLKARLLVERRPEFDLLETLRWEPDEGFVLFDEHLERVARSAVFFGYAVDLDLIGESLEKAVAGQVLPQRVRLLVGRDGGVVTTTTPLDEPFCPSWRDAPVVEVALSEEPVSSDDVFLFHKTTNRAVYDSRSARHGHGDVILTNERGEITETTIGNVALQFGSQWWTPPVEAGCLGGTFRGRLIADGVLRERSIAQHELAEADEVAVLNSVRGWRRAIVQG